MKLNAISHQFVEFIPDKLVPGQLYVSMQHATAIHLCACGCGGEVVTPLSPTDWSLLYDGNAITLDPSIGNWTFPCRSHYFIRGNKVVWVGAMSQSQIDRGRRMNLLAKEHYYSSKGGGEASVPPAVNHGDSAAGSEAKTHPIKPKTTQAKHGLWKSLLSRLGWR